MRIDLLLVYLSIFALSRIVENDVISSSIDNLRRIVLLISLDDKQIVSKVSIVTINVP